MKRFRALLVLLICIALPYSATAAMLQGMQCRHDGLGGIAANVSHGHGDRATHQHHHHAAQTQASGDHGCDCAVKCTCEHHCAASCGAAFAVTAEVACLFVAAAADHGIAAYPSQTSDVQGASVFRPPIAALTSAA